MDKGGGYTGELGLYLRAGRPHPLQDISHIRLYPSSRLILPTSMFTMPFLCASSLEPHLAFVCIFTQHYWSPTFSVTCRIVLFCVHVSSRLYAFSGLNLPMPMYKLPLCVSLLWPVFICNPSPLFYFGVYHHSRHISSTSLSSVCNPSSVCILPLCVYIILIRELAKPQPII